MVSSDARFPVGRHSFLVPSDYARLTIVFDLTAAPIAGVVHADQGEPFVGWMGSPTPSSEALPRPGEPLTRTLSTCGKGWRSAAAGNRLALNFDVDNWRKR